MAGMDSRTAVLPIRLVPTRRGQVLVIACTLGFVALALGVFFGFGMFGALRESGAGVIGIIFVVAFFLIPLLALVVACLKLMPGSPYFHLQIAAEGLHHRTGFRRRAYPWSTLSPFATHVETVTRRDKSGQTRTTTTHWVIAVAASDAAMDPALLDDPRRRLGAAAVKVDPDEYGLGSAAEDAAALAAWLNDIRTTVLAAPDRRPVPVTIPAAFADSAIAAPAAQGKGRLVSNAAPAVQTAPRRGGVIER
jgi:hypothetical protein